MAARSITKYSHIIKSRHCSVQRQKKGTCLLATKLVFFLFTETQSCIRRITVKVRLRVMIHETILIHFTFTVAVSLAGARCQLEFLIMIITNGCWVHIAVIVDTGAGFMKHLHLTSLHFLTSVGKKCAH